MERTISINKQNLTFITVYLLLFIANLFSEELFPYMTLDGISPRSYFGWSICALDFNGNGYEDVVIGAPMYSTDTERSKGAVFIYFGGIDIDNTPDLILFGESEGDQFGISVANAGDFNGDGYSDLLVGANAALNIGKAYVFYGGPDFGTTPAKVFTGEYLVDNFGYAVAGVGDVNQNGYDDIVIGALYNDERGSRTGKAYIIFGDDDPDIIPGLTIAGPESLMDFACNISRTQGDYNGDGIPDLLFGAVEAGRYWEAPGSALLFLGGETLSDEPDLWVRGEEPMDFFGGVVSWIGDFNGDSFDDFVVGSYNNDAVDSASGRAYVYYGGISFSETPDMIISGRYALEQLGGMVSSVYDINGDGYDDFAVAGQRCIFTGDTVDMIHIYAGGLSPNSEIDYWAYGENSDDRFGWEISPLGDINGDGFPGFAVGAVGFNDYSGRVYIYAGFRDYTPPEVFLAEPFIDATSSCPNQQISFTVFDEDGIDESTIRLTVEGVEYTSGENLQLIDDTLFVFNPLSDYNHGDTINFCLTQIADIRGAYLEEDICGHFIVDLVPPEILSIQPENGTILNTYQPELRFILSDEISGYDFTDMYIIVNHTDTFYYSDSSIYIDGQKGLFSSILAGLFFVDGDSVILTIGGYSDDPDYCEQNGGIETEYIYTIEMSWQTQIALCDSVGKCDYLVIGQLREMTDGYDTGVERIFVPPVPGNVGLGSQLNDERYPYIKYLNVDYRNVTNNYSVWTVRTYGNGTGSIRWSWDDLPEGVFLIDGYFDMKANSEYTLELGTEVIITYRYSPMIVADYEISAGWNLLSFPLYPRNYNLSELFSSSWLSYYRYDTINRRYYSTNRASVGTGYFVLSPSVQHLRIAGFKTEYIQARFFEGWNLIGGIFTESLIGSTIPPDILDPLIMYDYNTSSGTYTSSTILHPKKGYWLFADDEGLFFIP